MNTKERESFKLELATAARRLKKPALRKLSRKFYKLLRDADAIVKETPDLAFWKGLINDQWTALYEEVDRRALVEAEHKDAGEILFTTFHPRSRYSWRPNYTVRTPHRLIEFKDYHDEPFILLRDGRQDYFLKDFNEANGIKDA
jgi:hypothetical protein